MKPLVSILLVAVIGASSVSCTNSTFEFRKKIPKLDSSKPLKYSFKQPQRKVLSGKQSGQLGRPDMKSVQKQPNTYYSANGNICRRFSSHKTACYISGKWQEAVTIIGMSRK